MRLWHKKMIAVGVGLLMLTNSASVYATDQKTNLTLIDAQKLMTDNSVVLMDLEQGVRSLNEAEKKAIEGKEKVQGYYTDYKNFVKMYDEGVPDNPLAEATYGMYMAMFGKEPTKSFIDIYNDFIRTLEITHYDLYQKKEIMKLDRLVTAATLKYNVESLFNSLTSLEDTVATNMLYIQTLEKKQTEINQQYAHGMIAKFDMEKAELELIRTKLEAESLQRTKENLEMNLKSMIGIPENKEVVLKTEVVITPKVLGKLSDYQSALIKENIKLKKAQINIQTIEREIGIMKAYIKDANDDQRIEADQRLSTTNIAYMALENDLKTSLQKTYVQVIAKQKALNLSQRKLDESKSLLSKVSGYYEVGYVKKIDVYNAELAVVQATGAVKKLSNELIQMTNLVDQVVTYGIAVN